MGKSIVAFSLASIFSSIGLTSCARDSKFSNVISLKQLYSHSKQNQSSEKNKGNFVRINDNTIIFFSPVIREQLIEVVGRKLKSFESFCQIVDLDNRVSRIDKLMISMEGEWLKIGSYSVPPSELERLKLTADWQDVFEFCRSINKTAEPGEPRGIDDASVAKLAKSRFLITGGMCQAIRRLSTPRFGQLATLYNTQTHQIEKSFNLKCYRKTHSSLTLSNGEVLLIGGLGPSTDSNESSTIEIVNPIEGTSRLLKCRPKGFRPYATACLDARGNCIILAGWKDRLVIEDLTVDYLDIEHETITEVGKLKIRRFYSCNMDSSDIVTNAIVVGSNKILLSGGKSWIPGNTYGDILREDAEIVELTMP